MEMTDLTESAQSLLAEANKAGNLPAWKVTRAVLFIEAEAARRERDRLRLLGVLIPEEGAVVDAESRLVGSISKHIARQVRAEFARAVDQQIRALRVIVYITPTTPGGPLDEAISRTDVLAVVGQAASEEVAE